MESDGGDLSRSLLRLGQLLGSLVGYRLEEFNVGLDFVDDLVNTFVRM